MPPAPFVGLTTAVVPKVPSPWNDSAVLVRTSYLDQVAADGGLPVLLPPSPHAIADPDALLDMVDAVVLTGGPDIDPAHYGAERDARTRTGAPERDEFELVLARRAIDRRLPLLGICRGMQLLNVALGGTLHQHLPDVVGHGRHQRSGHAPGDDDHAVRLAPDSLAARAAGVERMASAESQHHQGVDRVGAGLVVSGWAVADGLPVTIERPGSPFVLGVQWHPEIDDGSRLMAALLKAARDAST